MTVHAGASRAAAALAQREASVIGWIDGVPVARDRLETRLATLRRGPLAAGLPAVGSSEDRQFVRWTAHVLFTEELCRREARRRGLHPDSSPPLDPVAAVQLGSINTAAWRACAEVGAVFAAVVPPEAPEGAAPEPGRRWWRVSYAVAADRAGAAAAPLRSIGWTTLHDLPPPLADQLKQTQPGVRVTPVRHGDAWHAALVDRVEVRTAAVAVELPGERLRRYARWLDARRAGSLRVAAGFEHPGDPSQPDNTHRH